MNEFSPEQSAEYANAVVEDMRSRAEAQGTTLEAILLNAIKTQRGYSEVSDYPTGT